MTVRAGLDRLAGVCTSLILWPSLLILASLVAHPVAAAPVSCPAGADSFFVSVCTLADGDSSVTVLVRPEGDLSVFEWSVAGVTHLFEQDFWVFDRQRGLPIDAERVSATVDSATREIIVDLNILDLVDPDSPTDIGDVHVTFSLTDIPAESDTPGESILEERVEIRPSAPFQGRLYVYNDFDLNDSRDDDTIFVIEDNKITQTDGTTTASVEAVSPFPNAFEVGECCDLFNDLLAFNLIELSNQDSVEGPADFESAFSWDVDFDGDNELVVELHNTITVPEPSNSLLAAVALASVAGLAASRRRRVRS